MGEAFGDAVLRNRRSFGREESFEAGESSGRVESFEMGEPFGRVVLKKYESPLDA